MTQFEESKLPEVTTIENTTRMQPINGPASEGCFKANLMRIAYDVDPTAIPAEGFQAISYKGYTCPVVAENGKECRFADPMVFLQKGVGLSAMGSSNFCKLESGSPRAFKKAALGSLGVRAARFGRDAFAVIREKLTD